MRAWGKSAGYESRTNWAGTLRRRICCGRTTSCSRAWRSRTPILRQSHDTPEDRWSRSRWTDPGSYRGIRVILTRSSAMTTRHLNGGRLASETTFRYVLITPARNEEQYIGRTLDRWPRRPHPPLRWVIVSDGSTDRTDEIVAAYQLATRLDSVDANARSAATGSSPRKSIASTRGSRSSETWVRRCRQPRCGHLFRPGLLRVFDGAVCGGRRGSASPEHPLSSTASITITGSRTSSMSRARASSFVGSASREIGGYVAIEGGGIDWIAVTTARMKGWQTRTFTEKTCLHHRPMGTGRRARSGPSSGTDRRTTTWGAIRFGRSSGAPYQMTRPPYLIGGGCLLAGYVLGLDAPVRAAGLA